MLSKFRTFWACLFLMAFVTVCAGSAVLAQDSAWHVSKSSGDVWITTSGVQPVALTGDASLNAGDTVRTGANGRVLLARGAETILIAANSVVGIPKASAAGMSTILQQAGSILLDVEKRNVQHFEVLTPYLAAVVKGTQFRVTVDGTGSQVAVLRGQVQVSDYKTGQYTLVNADQAASVSVQGSSGLSVSGSGTLSPIQQGTPRSSSVRPITIPPEGFSAPERAANGPQDRPANGPQRQAMTEPPQQAANGPQQQAANGPQGRAANGAPERAANGPQDRASAPARSAQSAPASSHEMSREADATSEDSSEWMSSFVDWAKGVLGFGGHKGRNDPVAHLFVLPAVIGFCVAVGAGVMRRRQKRRRR